GERSAMRSREHRVPESFQSLLEVGTPPRKFATRGERPPDWLASHSSIDSAAAVEAALGIGVVEVVQDPRHLNTLVFVQFVLELGVDAGPLVEHQILADHAAGICEPVRET